MLGNTGARALRRVWTGMAAKVVGARTDDGWHTLVMVSILPCLRTAIHWRRDDGDDATSWWGFVGDEKVGSQKILTIDDKS